MRSFFRRTFRSIGFKWRVLYFKLFADGVELPWSAQLSRGVRLHATDNGKIIVGSGVAIGPTSLIQAKGGVVVIGAGVFVGQGCVIVAQNSIHIGAGVLVAEYVSIRDQDHCVDNGLALSKSGFVVDPIFIGNDVWIGAKSTVLRGACIEDNVVIGAHSLVNGSISKGSIAVGVPAKIIKTRGC